MKPPKPLKEPNWRCECGAVNLGHPSWCWRCAGKRGTRPFVEQGGVE